MIAGQPGKHNDSNEILQSLLQTIKSRPQVNFHKIPNIRYVRSKTGDGFTEIDIKNAQEEEKWDEEITEHNNTVNDSMGPTNNLNITDSVSCYSHFGAPTYQNDKISKRRSMFWMASFFWNCSAGCQKIPQNYNCD